jgi:hypothetical protein
MFTIICLDTGAVVSECDTGEQAAEIARNLTSVTGKKHQPRRKKNESSDWREREAKRFADGTYVAVPWVNEWWFEAPEVKETVRDHFPHVSTEEPGKIAFTENAEKGEADRQTRMRPGRYLRQFYGHVIGESTCKHWAERFAGMYEPTTVAFGESADDFERVYTTGPNSCMSHAPCEYSSPFHPVRVYAAGDIQVAYLDSEDGITARVLVNKSRKLYGRTYGDEARLSAALNKLGYSYSSGALQGCRMVRHEDDDGRFVVPYVDGIYRARDDGDFLVCDGSGPINCENTCGLSERLEICACCGEPTNETFWINEEIWCESCRDNHASYCDYHEQYCASESVEMANGDHWCSDAFERHGACCDATGDNVHSDDTVSMADGEVWSQSYFDDNGFCCDHCGDNFAISDATDRDGEMLCESCNDDATDDTADATPRPTRVDHSRLPIGTIVDVAPAHYRGREFWCQTARYKITRVLGLNTGATTDRRQYRHGWRYRAERLDDAGCIQYGYEQWLAPCNIQRVIDPNQSELALSSSVLEVL